MAFYNIYINSYSNVEEIKKVLTKKNNNNNNGYTTYATARIAKSRKSHHICERAVIHARARTLAHAKISRKKYFLRMCERERDPSSTCSHAIREEILISVPDATTQTQRLAIAPSFIWCMLGLAFTCVSVCVLHIVKRDAAQKFHFRNIYI